LPTFWLAFGRQASSYAAARARLLEEQAEDEAAERLESEEAERLEVAAPDAGATSASRPAEDFECFSEELQDAMNAVAFEFRDRCLENGRRLDEALFVAVWSDARVRQAFRAGQGAVTALVGASSQGLCSSETLRKWREQQKLQGKTETAEELRRQRPDLFRQCCLEIKAKVLELKCSPHSVEAGKKGRKRAGSVQAGLQEAKAALLLLAQHAGLSAKDREGHGLELFVVQKRLVTLIESATCDAWKGVARDLLRRDLLANGLHTKECSVGFFSEEASTRSGKEFRDMDVAGLARVASARVCGGLRCGLGRACEAGPCEGAPRRAKACRWLRDFFPVQAEQEARARGSGETPWQVFWQQLWEEAVREGLELREPQRVCCQRSVRARVPLRATGQPASFCAPVLPVFDEAGQLGGGTEDMRRAVHAKNAGSAVHGSELFALPSDFLCCDCGSAFRQLQVGSLTGAQVHEFSRRLCMQGRGGRDALVMG
ncbi:MAG: hypothetical protein GY772_08865, partial [bacterium]|nr:hypothetical protein [bacterium]